MSDEERASKIQDLIRLLKEKKEVDGLQARQREVVKDLAETALTLGGQAFAERKAMAAVLEVEIASLERELGISRDKLGF